MALHQWVFQRNHFKICTEKNGGTTGLDDEFAAKGFENIGSWILGEICFGPIHGEWKDDERVGGVIILRITVMYLY